LALDEYIDGNWGSTTFPSGAKLVEVDGSFQVLDKNNNLLVDVSNIITLSTGNNYISAGKVDDSSGLASPSTTVTQILFLTFDDTHIGGDIQFTIGGLATITTNDTKPNGYGLYTEKTSYKASAVAGEGTAKGASIVISGTVSASGKGTLSL
jgi:hypothetical protein